MAEEIYVPMNGSTYIGASSQYNIVAISQLSACAPLILVNRDNRTCFAFHIGPPSEDALREARLRLNLFISESATGACFDMLLFPFSKMRPDRKKVVRKLEKQIKYSRHAVRMHFLWRQQKQQKPWSVKVDLRTSNVSIQESIFTETFTDYLSLSA